MSAPEDLHLDPEQQVAYDDAWKALQSNATFLAPIPTVVSLAERCEPEEQPVTLVTPTRGHHALFRALEELEGLEKEEQTLYEHTDLTRHLTTLLTGESYRDALQALGSLHAAGRTVPRRVCQHPFKKNDIVWVCRTCQADETCVLCHSCYSQSVHEGHDVAFYHAQAGGCCDCGDPDAWDPAGFCPHHGPQTLAAAGIDAASLPASLAHRVRGVVPAAVDWMVHSIAANAEAAYERARPIKRRGIRKMTSLGDVPTTSVARLPTDHQQHPNLTHRSESVPWAGSSDEVEDMEVDDSSDEDDSLYVETDDLNSMRKTRAHVFSPTAASSAKAERDLDNRKRQDEHALELGLTGCAGHGLYLVLHADDIHSTAELFDALREFLGTSNYYTDSLLGKLVRALRLYGQLVVWGTMEVAADLGSMQVNLWWDEDVIASTKIGAAFLDRASRLARHGMFCSIVTRDELMLEQRAVAVLQWLSAVARSCDPLCQTVAECILPNRHLVPLLRADFKMSARVTKAWYSLLLTLLAVPTFKSHLAAAYCDTYRSVTAKYARGMGVMERSGYTLSVQFLNRVTYVVDLVQGRDLMGKLGKSLLETLLVASRSQHLNGRLNPNHFVLTHRRYSPCISDLKCVLNVKGMPRLFACKGGTFLGDWISTLSAAQFMDPQSWRHWINGHVEDESRGWVGAFNASISLGSLFERLLGWEDDEPSPIQDPSSPLSRDLMPCLDLTSYIMIHGIAPWQRSEMLFYDATPSASSIEPHKRAPACLPFSTIAARHGATLAMRQLPASQVTPFSFHLPLHRFVAGCLRELCLRKDDSSGGMTPLMQQLQSKLVPKEQDELFRGLMEFPVLVLSRAAQVRAGLWRRNGTGLNDQVLNYSEPPFCRNMRDSDLLMVQFAVIGRNQHLSPETRPDSDVGMSFFVNLFLHRLGIFDFAGLAKAPNSDINRYIEETKAALYPREPKADDLSVDDLSLPWTYSPARDNAAALVLVEEFLHTMIVFASELPPVAPVDKEDHTRQAKSRLYREVVHRLASGPKQHSELSEVHHVLSHWDNVLLSEEGKMVNPDDATGAALEAVLAEVADRKLSRGKLEPDKWELKRSTWEFYDPSFYHISLRSHQSAAETRPKSPADSAAPFGWSPKRYGPVLGNAHPFFRRLRRDTTSDATIAAMAYRVLHLHCRENTQKDLSDLRGKSAYESSEKSETAMARSVHLFTLGACAWEDSETSDKEWRTKGGGSVGSVLFNRTKPPNVSDWVSAVLLANPGKLLECDWYEGEENSLLLLRRLAVDGGTPGGFVAQDAAIRAGAAWLCDFAVKYNTEAAALISPVNTATEDTPIEEGEKGESEIDKRKRMAKENAMSRMKAQAAKFAFMMDVELGDDEEDNTRPVSDMESAPTTPQTRVRGASMTSQSSASSIASLNEGETGSLSPFLPMTPEADHTPIPSRLLKTRPRCIICSDEESPEVRAFENDDGEGQRKKSRRKTESALGFVGYVQASTVLKGGGGPPPGLDSPMSPAQEFVGAHTALCGHAVHSECCESYLATVSHREDRAMGKRDEFRCPLCQRLSNCLVPFIDVGADWIDSPVCLPIGAPPVDTKSEAGDETRVARQPISLHDFLSNTPWWMARQNRNLCWDGHSAFIDKSAVTSAEMSEDIGVSMRSSGKRSARLRKKDVYAAWNAMMRTPRFVRRRLRSRGNRIQNELSSHERAQDNVQESEGEDSNGETIVWRRFMDQITDTSYRADSKRLGDEHLHDLFGEFRHYGVEKYAYNMGNRFTGNEPVDWPSCMFDEALSDTQKQEMSREKLLSKLLMTIQAFTYSCACEAFEARRTYRKIFSSSSEDDALKQQKNVDSMLSKFGIAGIRCGGKLVLMPRPSLDEDDGSQPFNGRLGRLRYLGLSAMAAAGAVAADLVQLALSLPLLESDTDSAEMDVDKPDRAPIAYPLLFGNVLTHAVAGMCATCGRGRARSDSLEFGWPTAFSRRGSFVSLDDIISSATPSDSVVEDCIGFLRLGLLARVLQVLLGGIEVPLGGFDNPAFFVGELRGFYSSLEIEPPTVESKWMRSCVKLLDIALSSQPSGESHGKSALPDALSLEKLHTACTLASSGACSFLEDAGTILQVLVPGAIASDDDLGSEAAILEGSSSHSSFEKMRRFFKLETMDEMLQSPLVQKVVANWYETACGHARAPSEPNASAIITKSVRNCLYRTQGFRVFDWPSAGSSESFHLNMGPQKTGSKAATVDHQPMVSTSMHVESVQSPSTQTSTAEVVRQPNSAMGLVTFNSKKVVPLLGGFSVEVLPTKPAGHPRVAVIPTSYTDLYAELATLLPDCEQTAVCLVCGEVLNASGKGECTRHSYKCGAGAGMFFLLQECSGLIMHKSKAAYIHSPYVDSHGETPQYRGRPLNLDLDRYEHLREVWYGHSVRQQVTAERGSSRQVILPDFY